MKIDFAPARSVEINGKQYRIIRSDFEVYAIGKEALKRCAAVVPDSVESIRSCIEWMANQVDYALGVGAIREISGGAPLDIVSVMRVLTHISATSGEEYKDYVKSEYLQPEQPRPTA